MSRLKDEIKYIKDALPKVARAYTKKALGDVSSSDMREFRKKQCESCGLFTGSNCNRNILIHEGDTVEKINLSEVVSSDAYTKIEVNGIMRKAISPDGKMFHLGCGCPLTGSNGKWALSFTEKELAIVDGSGACPMGKWSLQKYNDWNESING